MTLQHHLSTNRAQPNHVDTGEGRSGDPTANNLPRRRTILLVEDEPFVREATRTPASKFFPPSTCKTPSRFTMSITAASTLS